VKVEGEVPRLWVAGALALSIAAYWPLVAGPWSSSLGWGVVEREFFDPVALPVGMVLAVAGWMAWRRRGALAALDAAPHPAALPFALFGLACAVWARRADAADWLIFSLGWNALAFAVAARGIGAVRILAVPLVALLFAVPIPDPLENELIWALQRIATRGALWIHSLAGLGTRGSDVMLQHGESGFLVIEECSGFRGILTLTLASLVIRELFVHAGGRAWLVVGLAPPLAVAINIVRVAWIASGDAASSDLDHVAQGVSTLLAGSAALFCVGLLLARGHDETSAPPPIGGAWPWRPACGALGLLVLVAAAIPPRPASVRRPVAPADGFADRAGWVGEVAPTDYLFIGRVAIAGIVSRRFERRTMEWEQPQVVQLFVGSESPERPRDSPYSGKLALPGRDWSLLELSTQRDTRLFREVEVGVAARGTQRALVQFWRLGEEGAFRENLRSFLAVSGGQLDRPPRRVVRLVTPILREGPTGRRQARHVMDSFLIAFGGELEALELGGS
jgi:exosortase